MTAQLKDNAHIRSNQDAARAALERARARFGALDGVVSVGFGLRQAGGEFTDDIAIVVLVRKKKKSEDLAPGQRIPPSFEGYRTDVRIVPDVRPGVCNNTATYQQIKGGIQISTRSIPTGPGEITTPLGTLTSIVRKRNDAGRDNVYLLSNKHVLQTTISGVGDAVYHPYPPDRPDHDSETLGPVMPGGTYGNFSYVVTPGTLPRNFFIDCAVARIDIDCPCCGSTCTRDKIVCRETIIDLAGENTESPIADVRSIIGQDLDFLGEKLVKVGRTTGRTVGTVVSVHLDSPITGDPSVPGSIVFLGENCLEIAFDKTSTANHLNCRGHAWFAEEGDSGSPILDLQNKIVGIVSQVPNPANALPDATVLACHILPVIESLKICIPTLPTGTSTGSTRATDGSGLNPIALTAAQSTLPSGRIVFTSAEGRAALPAPMTPMPVTDDEVRHMRELLAQFRDTRLGPQLHDLFGHLRREVGYLVRNSRPVKVAWVRHKGPAFLAHVLNHLAGRADRVPHEVQGVTRRALLVRMREVLSAHGSNPLRHALERYGDDLLEMLSREDCDSVADCVAWMQEEGAGVSGKDNAHILSNPRDFQAAYLRAVEFFGKNPGVVSVGFGQKHSGGDYRDDLAIIVFVREKKSDDALAPGERIPPTFEGYKTDVVVVPEGSLAVCENEGKYATIQGGIQIVPQVKTPGAYSAGTLACIVHQRGSSNRENVLLLTCRHVLFGDVASAVGDYVYHPFPPPLEPSNSLGAIQDGAIFDNKAYTYVVNGAPATTTHFLDAGVARINLDTVCCCDSTCTQDTTKTAPTIVDLALDATNTVADVRNCIIDATIVDTVANPRKVFKVGRTTGRTVGRVRRVNGASNIPRNPNIPNSPRFMAVGLIEIDFDVADISAQPNGVNCKGLAWFADHGDSGSLVVDEQRRAIGIVSIGPSAKLPNGQPNRAPGPSFACHIVPVLDHLNICIPCTPPPPATGITGTSHGSSLATDGSGVKPAALPPDQSTLPVGKFVFTPGREKAAPER